MVAPLEFLESARAFGTENRFIVGTFERGVTFYRQQIRALNLIYAMVEARDDSDKLKIKPKSRIVVIGGGAFGVTAAAAAAYAEFSVVVVERQQILHLQHGCDTRWLHPRSYDWPDPASQSQLARLPIMNWAASTAALVASELERQFQELTEKRRQLRCISNANEFRIQALQDGGYEVHVKSGDAQEIVPADAIIYAVGLGTETSENEPYWRNDRLGQTELSFQGRERVRYLVSGLGDGALVDLCRLTIRDFRQDTILLEMFSGAEKDFLAALDRLRSNPNHRPGELYDHFSRMENDLYRPDFERAKAFLRDKRRQDTAVTLNAPDESLRLGLTLRSVSLSNALLAFCLHRISAFDYASGALNLTNPPTLARDGSHPSWLAGASRMIFRHGTDRIKALKDVGCNDAVIAFMKRQSEIRDSGQPIYPAGWWGRYTAPADAANPGRAPAPVEFVPPALMTHATTFVATLANALSNRIPNKNFRMALHRFVMFDGREVYQQVTPYGGMVEDKTGVGRYFRATSGIVGLAALSGSLVIARKTSDKNFHEIWEVTPLDRAGAKEIKPYVGSLFACPLFGPIGDNDNRYVQLVLFADSAELDFFNDEVIAIISNACRGFVDVLEDLHTRRALRPVPSYYTGLKVEINPELEARIAKMIELGVIFHGKNDEAWRAPLSFRTIKSLDFEVESLLVIGA